ncbi:MAG: class I SAM-dependent methyltransferase [Pseudobdellovibrionaceae bacterium]|jgi:2-polyprenyl-3-methyl-5-hydroxy-6-metoxy-1,4-benzoquinol methylase
MKHNFASGPIHYCQACGSEKLDLVIDLGHQPLCDSLLSKEELNLPEKIYPLRQYWCRDCSLNQIDYIVPKEELYHRSYPYRSGITKELADYQKAFADDVIKTWNVPANSLCVDIGSNDGTLLTGFQKNGMRVLGVEPTDIALIAREENGIPTRQTFFSQEVAQEIFNEQGPAHVVTATNVFAHVQDLGSIILGLKDLIGRQGIFILENHYLLQVLKKVQFDTIYHEHLRTYSLHSLVALFKPYELEVIDARQVDRYGGNIRVVVARQGSYPIRSSVQEILSLEKKEGFFAPETYLKFRQQSLKIKNDLLSLLLQIKSAGQSVVGNSCPGRCSTLLNFAGIRKDLLPYLAEQPTSLKLGMYLPGMHLPVLNNQCLIDEQPDYVLLLAWHYADPIVQQLRARGLKSKFIVPFPEVKVLEN